MTILRTILFALAFLAAACGPETPDPALAAAEALLDERPDSALLLLERSDTARLSPPERARRRVLLARAADRSDRTPASDSLIRPALVWYERHGTHAQRALAWYYYGTAHETADRLDEAVKGYSTALLHAERAAGDTLSDRLRGVVYHTLGGLYSRQGYNSQAREHFDRAARAFDALGAREDALYSLVMKSTMLYREHRYGEAIRTLEAIRHEAGNDFLRVFIDTYLVHYHAFADDWSQERLLRERAKIDRRRLLSLSRHEGNAEADRAPLVLYDVLSAILFCKVGQADSALVYVHRSLSGLGELSLETAGMLRIAASVQRMQSRTDSAYLYEARYASLLDSLHDAERTQQIAELEERFRSRHSLELMRTRHRYQLWIFALAGLLLAALAARGVLASRRRMNDSLALLASYRASHEGLVARLRATDAREAALKELVEGRLTSLRDLAAAYYTYGDTRRLTEKIRELALSPALLADTVRMADLYHDNALRRLREQCPGWPARSYDFTALVMAGFSAQEISVLLGMTLNGVYTLKSKLKRRIAASNAPDKAFFAAFFD